MVVVSVFMIYCLYFLNNNDKEVVHYFLINAL